MPQTSSKPSLPFKPVTSLVLHNHTHPDFATKLSTGFSSIQSWSQYAAVHPLIATLSNVGTKTTRAYAVFWKIQTADGVEHYMHTTSIRKHFMIPGTLQTLQPNEVRLVSPFFNLSSAQYGDNPEKLTRMLPPTIPWLDGKVTETTVDAVIHEDDTTAGTDLFKLREAYVGARHAEHDAGVAMRAFLAKNPSVTPQQLDAELQARAEKNIRAVGTDAKARYLHARAQEAQNLRGTLRWHGMQGFIQELALRVRYERDQIRQES